MIAIMVVSAAKWGTEKMIEELDVIKAIVAEEGVDRQICEL